MGKKAKYERYLREGRRKTNALRRIRKHLKHHPKDAASQESLERIGNKGEHVRPGR